MTYTSDKLEAEFSHEHLDEIRHNYKPREAAYIERVLDDGALTIIKQTESDLDHHHLGPRDYFNLARAHRMSRLYHQSLKTLEENPEDKDALRIKNRVEGLADYEKLDHSHYNQTEVGWLSKGKDIAKTHLPKSATIKEISDKHSEEFSGNHVGFVYHLFYGFKHKDKIKRRAA